MFVASVLLSFRKAFMDPTIQAPNEFAVDDDVVNMHLYQPSPQCCIVDVVTADPLGPTIHVAKSKLAVTLTSPPHISCAKTFVPRRKKYGNVCTVVDVEKGRSIFLALEIPSPIAVNTPAEANFGKSIDVAIIVPTRLHNPLTILLDCNSTFVRSSSMIKPFGTNVIGSWSSRAVFIGTSLIKTKELIRVAMLFLVNVRSLLLMNV